MGHQGRIEPIQRDRLASDGKGALHDQAEENNNRHHARKPQLLGNHRQQKIGMRFRQIEQLFNARPEPDAKQFASAKSNERMRELIASPEGISPGIHEAKNTVAAIGRGNDHHRKSNEQHHDQHRKQSGPHSAQEQNAHGDRDDHHEGAKVWLLEQQDANHHHRPSHGQEGFFQIVHVRHLAHRVIRRIEHNKKFHHFGRL